MDSPLTARGRSQIDQWGTTLGQWHWDRIVASDLGRVVETVEILNKKLHLPITYDTRLREQSWGRWEGLTLPHIHENFSQDLALRVAKGWGFSAPGGESRDAVRQRVQGILTEISSNFPGEKILIICHQGVIKALIYHLMNRAFLPEEDPLLQVNGFHLVALESGVFSINKLNIPRSFRS